MDIDRGVDVIFPMNQNNITVNSRVPNPTISMQTLSPTHLHMYLTLFITGKYPGPVSNTFLSNSFLPSNFDGYA